MWTRRRLGVYATLRSALDLAVPYSLSTTFRVNGDPCLAPPFPSPETFRY